MVFFFVQGSKYCVSLQSRNLSKFEQLEKATGSGIPTEIRKSFMHKVLYLIKIYSFIAGITTVFNAISDSMPLTS